MSQIGFAIPGGTGGMVQTLTGNAGGPVGPDGAGNINLLGSNPITVTGNPGTNTLTITIANASEIQIGAVELATAAETITGTSTALAVHPSGLNAKLGAQTANGLIYGQGGAGTALGSLAAATNGQLPIGNTGNPPTLATLTAGAGIAITNGAGSITIAADNAGFQWQVVTMNQTAADNQGYFANDAGVLSFALPAASAVGDTFQVVAMSAGGWIVTQAGAQQIRLGNQTTTIGAGGSIASTAQGDWITLVCSVANTNWIARTEQGNLTVV